MSYNNGYDTKAQPLIWGFVLSLLLILCAYVLVKDHAYAKGILLGTVMGLAALQAVIQFVCFLHLGKEKKSHFGLLMFILMVVVTIIIVGGSMWIMSNLDYYVMPGMSG